MLLLMLSFVLKSLVVMQHFKAVWMISLCHMLIQEKSIIIRSVPEILHINDIQCQLILMKHLSLFLWLSWFIQFRTGDIAFLAPYGFTPPQQSVHVPYDYKWKLLSFLFFIHLFIYSFSPLTVGRRDEDKKLNINLRSTVKYTFSQYFGSGTDEPVIRS